MTARRALFILISALILAGCGGARGRAVTTLKRLKAERLRKEVALYYKNIFAEHRKTIVTVSPQYWSWSFTELHPQHITAYPDGFAFCLESSGDSESGLYIVPDGMEHEPASTRWASFEKISEGVFWYSFKP